MFASLGVIPLVLACINHSLSPNANISIKQGTNRHTLRTWFNGGGCKITAHIRTYRYRQTTIINELCMMQKLTITINVLFSLISGR